MSDLICELVKETDPFLREKPEVFNFENPQVDPEKLQEQLIENMIHHVGLGLSANQIGIPVTVFAMRMDDHALVVFNPEILEWSEETTYMREGCLSFFGGWGKKIGIERNFKRALGTVNPQPKTRLQRTLRLTTLNDEAGEL